MSAALIFLASALSAPQVDRSFSRQAQEYYPTWALQESQQMSAAMELAVLPNGKVASCSVLKSVGNPHLAEEACARTIGRKLRPAIGTDGNPTFGLFRTVITMTLSPAPVRLHPLVPEPEVELIVNRLPDSQDSLDLDLVLLISAEGSVEHCQEQRSSERDSSPAAYVEVACREAKGLEKKVFEDPSGTAIHYVRSLRVRFSRESANPEA